MITGKQGEFRSSRSEELLPEGVVAYGHRYKARIQTPTRTYTFGEFDTPEEAHRAYKEAQSAQWNG